MRPALSSVQPRIAGIAIAIGFHVLVAVGLMRYEPIRVTLADAAPIMVSLISPPRIIEKPEERAKPLPVKPRVQRPRPAEKPPVTAAVTEAPAPIVAPPPAPVPPVSPVVAAPPALPALAAPAPAPVVPPNFNASYLNNPVPSYPALSRRMGEEGKVVLRVFVNQQGLPTEVELWRSSGFSRLDGVALETVRKWKFMPARHGEQPIGAWVLVPISFSLRS
jgi:protein TonB